MEKIYLNADEGSWIKAGRKQLGGITYVLDGFHLEKSKKVEEASEYLLSNWTAARLRLKHKDRIEGSSTESHVSHSLSSRMSTRPMGWSS